jgi:hypothetical protein
VGLTQSVSMISVECYTLKPLNSHINLLVLLYFDLLYCFYVFLYFTGFERKSVKF